MKQENLLSCLLFYVLERTDSFKSHFVYEDFFFSNSHGNKIWDKQGGGIKVSESFGDFTEWFLMNESPNNFEPLFAD